jgi:hypothetical protein
MLTASALGTPMPWPGVWLRRSPCWSGCWKKPSVRDASPSRVSVTWLSEAYLLAGHREEVRASTTRALARTRQERGHEAWALRLLGEMAAQCQPLGVEPAAAPYR